MGEWRISVGKAAAQWPCIVRWFHPNGDRPEETPLAEPGARVIVPAMQHALSIAPSRAIRYFGRWFPPAA